MRNFKGICDSLAVIGKLVEDKEKVFCLLTSLGPQFENFTTKMLKPPKPTYVELTSQLQNFDQRWSWFSNDTEGSVSHVTFLSQQNGSRSMTSSYRSFPSRMVGSYHFTQGRSAPLNYSGENRFSSVGHGFQAQRSQGSNTCGQQQRRQLPPSAQQTMTPKERGLYKNEVYQYCEKQGYIAKICWWIPNQGSQNNDILQALAALTLDNSIVDSE